MLNYIVVALYFCFLASIRVVFKKLNRDEDDYFRAGSRSCWWMVGMSLLPNDGGARLCIAGVALPVCLIGAGMFGLSRRAS